MLEDGPHSTGSSSPMGPLGNRQERSGTQFPKMPTRWKRTNFQQSQISRNSQSPVTQGVLQGRLPSAPGLSQVRPPRSQGDEVVTTHTLTNK